MLRRVLPLIGVLLVLATVVVMVWRSRPAPTPPGPAPAPPRVATPGQATLPALPSDLDRLDPNVRTLIAETRDRLAGDPSDPRRWLELGQAFHANEYRTQAINCYRRALDRHGDLAMGAYLLARLQTRRGDFDEAAAMLARVAELDPSYAPARWRLGWLHLDAGRFDAAETSFRRATEVDARGDPAWFGLARIFLETDRLDAAVAILEPRAVQDDVNGRYASHLLGTAYRRLNRPEDAAAALERGVAEAPRWPDPWEETLDRYRAGYGAQIARAGAMIDAGATDAAIDLLETLREDHSDRPTVLVQLGLAYRQGGRMEDSIEALEAALALDDGFAPAHFHLAVAYLQMSRSEQLDDPARMRDEARRHASRVVEINPAYAPAHSVIGDLAMLEQRYDDALGHFGEARRCDADDPRWPYREGVILILLQRWDGAVEAMRRVVSIHPRDVQAWRGLGLAALELGRLAEAEAAVARAETLEPRDPRTAAIRAQVQAKQREAAGGQP